MRILVILHFRWTVTVTCHVDFFHWRRAIWICRGSFGNFNWWTLGSGLEISICLTVWPRRATSYEGPWILVFALILWILDRDFFLHFSRKMAIPTVFHSASSQMYIFHLLFGRNISKWDIECRIRECPASCLWNFCSARHKNLFCWYHEWRIFCWIFRRIFVFSQDFGLHMEVRFFGEKWKITCDFFDLLFLEIGLLIIILLASEVLHRWILHRKFHRNIQLIKPLHVIMHHLLWHQIQHRVKLIVHHCELRFFTLNDLSEAKIPISVDLGQIEIIIKI